MKIWFNKINESRRNVVEVSGSQITIGRDFSTRHMAEVSRKYNIPVTWTALLSHLYGPGGHRKQLDLAAEQRADLDQQREPRLADRLRDEVDRFKLSGNTDTAAALELVQTRQKSNGKSGSAKTNNRGKVLEGIRNVDRDERGYGKF